MASRNGRISMSPTVSPDLGDDHVNVVLDQATYASLDLVCDVGKVTWTVLPR